MVTLTNILLIILIILTFIGGYRADINFDRTINIIVKSRNFQFRIRLIEDIDRLRKSLDDARLEMSLEKLDSPPWSPDFSILSKSARSSMKLFGRKGEQDEFHKYEDLMMEQNFDEASGILDALSTMIHIDIRRNSIEHNS